MTDQHPETGPERTERRDEEPESLRLRSLAPTLTADDLKHTLRFYEEGLGFTVQERWEEEGELRGVMLAAGECHIGLSQDDWGQGRDRRKGVGFRIWAETVQDLEALSERLRRHGIEHDGPSTEPWGTPALTVTDPDGFKLTFTPPRAE